MTRADFRRFLEQRLKVEQDHGFRHCSVMLAEIIEIYDSVDEPKVRPRNCAVCGRLFTPASPRTTTCGECKGSMKHCVVCGDSFRAKKRDQNTCPSCMVDINDGVKNLAKELVIDEAVL